MTPDPTSSAAVDELGFVGGLPTTINEVLLERARIQGDARFVTFLADGDRDEQVLSFADLERRGLAVAALLRERGLEPGDRVLLMLPTGLEFVLSFFGALLAGMVPVPVYPPARLTRLEHYLRTLTAILDVARCRCAILDRQLVSVIGPRIDSGMLVLTDADVRRAEGQIEAHPLLPASPGFIQFTSGTTSNPRGVLLLQQQILAQLDPYTRALEAGPEDVAVSWLPLYHDLGLIGNLLAALYCGMHQVLFSPIHFLQEPFRWVRAISRYQAGFVAGPNFAFELLVRRCPPEQLRAEGIDLSSLRNIGCGGEVVSMATIQRFRAHFEPFGLDPNVFNPSFGIAENTLVVTIHHTGEPLRSLRLSREALQRNEVREPSDEADAFEIPGNGKALEGIAVRIVDAAGQPLPERGVGEIWVRSPSLAAGYFNNKAATDRTFVRRDDGRWLRTGDRGFLAAGDLYICGRVKDMMIVGGRNYYPQDIEEIVAAVEGVRAGNVVAFSCDDQQGGGERPVLVCELRPEVARDPDEVRRDVIEAVGSSIGLALADVVFVPKGTVPKTSSGKIQRGRTREAYLRGDYERVREPSRLGQSLLKLRLGAGALRYRFLGRPAGVASRGSLAPRSRAETSGVDLLDPRIEDALRSAEPDLEIELSPELRIDALGLGSLERVEFMVALEYAYEAEAPPQEMAATLTLGALQRLLEKHEGTRPRSPDAPGAAPVPFLLRELQRVETEPVQPSDWRSPRTAGLAFALLRNVSRVAFGLRARGLEHLPRQGAYILAGNHESYLDPGWLLNVLPPEARQRFAGISWEGAPGFTQWCVSLAETIPIDTDNAFHDAMRGGLRALKQGKVLLVFPEGARSHDGKLLPFRPGVGVLGLVSQVPIVPFHIHGAFQIYPRGRSTPRLLNWRTPDHRRLEIHFGAPITPQPLDPTQFWQQSRVLTDQVREAVAEL